MLCCRPVRQPAWPLRRVCSSSMGGEWTVLRVRGSLTLSTVPSWLPLSTSLSTQRILPGFEAFCEICLSQEDL